jgi:hypothetical protein
MSRNQTRKKEQTIMTKILLSIYATIKINKKRETTISLSKEKENLSIIGSKKTNIANIIKTILCKYSLFSNRTKIYKNVKV